VESVTEKKSGRVGHEDQRESEPTVRSIGRYSNIEPRRERRLTQESPAIAPPGHAPLARIALQKEQPPRRRSSSRLSVREIRAVTAPVARTDEADSRASKTPSDTAKPIRTRA
jgi:hypothetical protein